MREVGTFLAHRIRVWTCRRGCSGELDQFFFVEIFSFNIRFLFEKLKIARYGKLFDAKHPHQPTNIYLVKFEKEKQHWDWINEN